MAYVWWTESVIVVEKKDFDQVTGKLKSTLSDAIRHHWSGELWSSSEKARKALSERKKFAANFPTKKYRLDIIE